MQGYIKLQIFTQNHIIAYESTDFARNIKLHISYKLVASTLYNIPCSASLAYPNFPVCLCYSAAIYILI